MRKEGKSMDRNQNNEGRRAVSRATKLRRRKIRMNFILLAGFAALIAIRTDSIVSAAPANRLILEVPISRPNTRSSFLSSLLLSSIDTPLVIIPYV